MDIVNEIKSYSEDKIVLGSKRTIKYLKLGKISKVYVANNVPEEVLEDLKYYASLSNIEVKETNLSNVEIGIVLKKPFKVSVIGILK
ncbi:50S ribosomal protein L30 [Nanoarchaeota archaeon NZ13-N]|uniref:50S ribosomal protein L30 n=1 Tax=Candidatus Nanoclepta minutus TaxID=1940235 RepID=A0A397WNE6_9ARCH|nr:MAG: 50S ribosomal protein L30 [Nanoarchaeota archaeon NZ13-N]RIB35604.1 MAG: 50S ribosomal protein L30 [Candidatus Nanoclepta minutus]